MSSFILLSTILMLSAMYLQNYYIYGNKFSKFNIKNVFEQREVIEHEYFKHQTTDKAIRHRAEYC